MLTRIIIALLIPFSVYGQNIHQLFEYREKYSFPFKHVQDQILIDIKLEGVLPLTFIFDTGAETTLVFDKYILQLFGHKKSMRVPILGGNVIDTAHAEVYRSVGIEVENLPFVRIDMLALEEYNNALEQNIGKEVHGILGSNFFRHSIVRIDYEKEKITFYRRKALIKDIESYHRIPSQFLKSKPHLWLHQSSGNQVIDSLLVLMDTGAGLSYILHSNTDSSIRIPDKVIRGTFGQGISGALVGIIGRTDSIVLDSFLLQEVITHYLDLNAFDPSGLQRNGMLGNSFLKRFHIIIDYIKEELYLKPNKYYNQNFGFDRSGLDIVATGAELDKYIVRNVIHGSPAAQAGILPGDRILNFQYFPAFLWSLEGIQKRLQKKVGKRIRLKVQRGNFKLKKILYLEDLFETDKKQSKK